VQLPEAVMYELINGSPCPQWEAYTVHDDELRRNMQTLLDMAANYNLDGSASAAEDPLSCLDLVFTVYEASPFPDVGPEPTAPAAAEAKAKAEAEAETEAKAEAKAKVKATAVVREVALVEGGESKEVTASNVKEYVALACRRRLLRGADEQVAAIREGLMDVIPEPVLRIFEPLELGSIISGPVHVVIKDWRANTVYEDGYSATSPVVVMFWEVVRTFTEEQRRSLLLFWSGTSIPPTFGAANLATASDEIENWCLAKASLPRSQRNLGAAAMNARLPEAATCDRRLMLPEYSNREALRHALELAMTHGAVGYDRV